MKSPAKVFSLLAGGLALLAVSCASDRGYEARNAPREQFYCHACEEYHPYQHEHYRYYEDARYQRPHPAAFSRIKVISQPGRSTPMGPPPEDIRPRQAD
jgi:hypothetical protein